MINMFMIGHGVAINFLQYIFEKIVLFLENHLRAECDKSINFGHGVVICYLAIFCGENCFPLTREFAILCILTVATPIRTNIECYFIAAMTMHPIPTLSIFDVVSVYLTLLNNHVEFDVIHCYYQ